MEKEYIVQKFTSPVPENVLDDIEEAEINEYPWQGYRDGPHSSVKMYATEKALVIYFSSCEKDAEKGRMAFLLSPDGKDERYMRIDVSFRGVEFFDVGTKTERTDLLREIAEIPVSTFLNGEGYGVWWAKVTLPFLLIFKYFAGFDGKSGTVMSGNFYKYGTDEENGHYVCWNPVTSGKPDFHRPEDFGKIIIF